MIDVKSAQDWAKVLKWLCDRGLAGVIIIAVYFFLASKDWLSPSVQIATAYELRQVEARVTEQSKNYRSINKSLLEIRIGQSVVLIRDMERDIAERQSAGRPVPAWLEDQVREEKLRLKRLQVEADKTNG